MPEVDDTSEHARRRVVRNIALTAGFAAFAVSFPAFNAMLPGVLVWLAGVDGAAFAPDYGAPALARIALACVLAALVGGAVFASLARGVIFEQRRLASPAPRTPAGAGLAFAVAGAGAYLVAREAIPAFSTYARWNDDGSALLLFIALPAAAGFLWRLMGLAAEGAAARRRERTRPSDPFSRRGGI